MNGSFDFNATVRATPISSSCRTSTFHDLRHTAATLALADGVHPKIVSERLGYSSVSMTLDRCSPVSMDMQRDAADRLDRLTGGQ
jgi:integrase